MREKCQGEIYQRESRYSREGLANRWMSDADPGAYKAYPDASWVVELPAPRAAGGGPVWEVMSSRRSVRRYETKSLSVQELSQLLWAMNGITRRGSHYQLRASPSAGALYPVETYVVVNRVEGVEPGVYHHNILRFSLEGLRRGSFGGEAAGACLGQKMCERAGAVFVWTAVIARCRVKYQERAYRYVYMDAGHIAQNLYLASSALELGCCAVGAFFDEEVNALVGVDGEDEFAVYLATVGIRS